MDLATIIGIAIAMVAVLGGQLLEGGHISSILQPTAAIIVIGGTLGAVAVQFPKEVLRRALFDLRGVFQPKSYDVSGTVRAIVVLAQRARRDGLVSIETEAEKVKEPFLRKALALAIDGTDGRTLRATLERELDQKDEEHEAAAKVVEAAGGYAPTVGILGAVLGLIHVMENLSDPSKLGGGIAVAFVATVYGVGLANLFFLPMAGKLKLRAREHSIYLEVMVDGVCALAEGENPRMLERKLSIYLDARQSGESRKEAQSKSMRSAA